MGEITSKSTEAAARGHRRRESALETSSGAPARRFQIPTPVVIEPYIVDFVCFHAKLIVEADGGQHGDRAAYDVQRTAELEAMGYSVVCFWNHEILKELDSVLWRIEAALTDPR